ncbi:MAG: hypothetical protein U5O39_15670 [Gammaproteobacteria bacterium]|nr:hypothetical protein [Gammaproteobacteria bacterium]
MSIHLRQICLVARKLDPVIADLTSVLGIQRCYVDEGVAHFGLENTLMAIGNNFLEVVAPTREGTAAGRYLERRSGDGGYMVICQAGSHGEQQALRNAAIERGIRVAYEADRDHWNICQLHPRDMIAAFLEIDWDLQCDFNGNWMPASGTAWQENVDQSVTVDFTGVELQADDVDALQHAGARRPGSHSKQTRTEGPRTFSWTMPGSASSPPRTAVDRDLAESTSGSGTRVPLPDVLPNADSPSTGKTVWTYVERGFT